MQISDGCTGAGNSDADNVKARVLHVMNMNHTKKKAKHMAQEEDGKKGKPWTLPFSKQNQKKTLSRSEQRSFKKLDGI